MNVKTNGVFIVLILCLGNELEGYKENRLKFEFLKIDVFFCRLMQKFQLWTCLQWGGICWETS